jgi:hypothetical protein
MGGWKPAKKEAQRDIQARRTLQMRYIDVTNRIHKCYNKIADLNQLKQCDDLRPDILKNIDAKLSFWEDELWIAINDKATLKEEAERLEQEILAPCRN